METLLKFKTILPKSLLGGKLPFLRCLYYNSLCLPSADITDITASQLPRIILTILS